MKKWTKWMTLYSVAVLASVSTANVFADENIPVATDTPTVAVTSNASDDSTTPPADDTSVPSVPTDPVEEPSDPVVTPTDPDTSVPDPSQTEPENPTDQTTTPSDDTSVPSTEEKPSEPSQTTESSQSSQPTQLQDTKNQGGVSVPTVDGGTTTLSPDTSIPTNNPSISAQTAVDAGASQVGTTSTVTGQVVSNVTPSTPVYTNTGYQIVSTQDSQVVVSYSDGSTATVSPETVGGVVNEDKTITVTDQAGKKTTLPHTGEKGNAMLSMAGVGILAALGAFFFKKRSLGHH